MNKTLWIIWLLLTVIPSGCGNGGDDGDDPSGDDVPDWEGWEGTDPIDENPSESPAPSPAPAPEPAPAYPLLPPAPEIIRPFELRDSYTLNAHTCATAIQEFELSNVGDIIFGKNDLVMHVTDPGDSGIVAKTQYRAERKVGRGGYPFLHIIIPKCYAGILLFPRQAQEASALSGLGFSQGDFYMTCQEKSEGEYRNCYLSYERVEVEVPLIQSSSTSR